MKNQLHDESDQSAVLGRDNTPFIERVPSWLYWLCMGALLTAGVTIALSIVL